MLEKAASVYWFAKPRETTFHLATTVQAKDVQRVERLWAVLAFFGGERVVSC